MVKKKRNEDGDDGSSTSSDEDIQMNNSNNSSNPSCPHLGKSVDLTKLRKIIKTNGVQTTQCSECNKISGSANEDDAYSYENSLWLCLKCGSQLCGRGKNQHALNHYNTPRSDSHALAVHTTTFVVWCYPCDNEVNENSSRKLLECITFIKREAQKIQTDSNSISNLENKIASVLDTMKPLIDDTEGATNFRGSTYLKQTSSKENMQRSIEYLPRVRGLSNLGNTCFFNAVIQCLAQTPFLLEILKESADPGEKFHLLGGVMKIDNNEVTLPPIKGELLKWGGFTSTLAETLEELQTISGGVFTPRKLLQQLTSKWPQFGGGNQHDSHELLRHLLESVRSEDLRRYQTVILNHLGYHTNIDPAKVSDDTKQKIKFYGSQAQDRILRPEPVFRGFLVSTLTCQDCFNTSSRHEYFLDISLPVSTEKPQPPARRKISPEPACGSSSACVSKSQLKKEKRLERKAKRNQKHASRKLNQISSSEVAAAGDCNRVDKNYSSSGSSPLSESDADVEDNDVDDQRRIRHNVSFDANGNNEIKSPLIPEKIDDMPENPYKDKDNDSALEDSDIEPLTGSNSATNVVCEASMSTTGIAHLLSKQQLKSSNNDDPNNENPKTSTEDVDREQQRAMRQQQQRHRQRTLSHVDWSTTLAPRYQCEDGELSLQSCLNNFTAMELMTGNNKVGCEACTERINGKNGKTVYTNATKQFLISSPPAVLILHLKRFQVGARFMFRKIVKTVSFPVLLDIAPFCGSKVKKLPNINPHQKKLLYSLYGIVEHSGGMHGGHYVAYVKVRPKLDANDPRWQYLPKGSKTELDQVDEQKACLDEQLEKAKQRVHSMTLNDSDDSFSFSSSSSSSSDTEEGAVGGSDEPTIPPGKWYCVSDSRVQEVNEETVLKSQAYLLFYERIF